MSIIKRCIDGFKRGCQTTLQNAKEECNMKYGNDIAKNEKIIQKSIVLNEMDAYFVDAGRLSIEHGKMSIGMIQRQFKIGFNRAARIADQLEQAGIVGVEVGTSPRKVLMTMEEFEQQLEYLAKESSESDNSKEAEILDESIPSPEIILKEVTGIEADYSNDGEALKNLKNVIIPSTSNENQIEIINELLKYNSLETMSLVLIDTSIINYSGYNGIPQLLIPVITDGNKIGGAVNWCYAEMEDRINKFVNIGVKNIDSFNEKTTEDELPRIICIANEANEFFKHTSTPLERLFINSNMVGIHFIIFSRFSLKSLSLGIVGELLEVSTTNKLKILLSQNESINDNRSMARNFDDMDGHQFEYFCADVLRKNGFENVEVTQGSGDHGIDILAEKDDITYAIQCKCYSSDIGNAAVQQAHTGKSIYKKDIAVVLTNRYFTAQAKEEAAALGVKLWDRDKMNDLCSTIQNKSTENVIAHKKESKKSIPEDVINLPKEDSKIIFDYLKTKSLNYIESYLQIEESNNYQNEEKSNVEPPITFYSAEVHFKLNSVHYVFYSKVKPTFYKTSAYRNVHKSEKVDIFQIDVFYDLDSISYERGHINISADPEVNVLGTEFETMKLLEEIDDWKTEQDYLTEQAFYLKESNYKRM